MANDKTKEKNIGKRLKNYLNGLIHKQPGEHYDVVEILTILSALAGIGAALGAPGLGIGAAAGAAAGVVLGAGIILTVEIRNGYLNYKLKRQQEEARRNEPINRENEHLNDLPGLRRHLDNIQARINKASQKVKLAKVIDAYRKELIEKLPQQEEKPQIIANNNNRIEIVREDSELTDSDKIYDTESSESDSEQSLIALRDSARLIASQGIYKKPSVTSRDDKGKEELYEDSTSKSPSLSR